VAGFTVTLTGAVLVTLNVVDQIQFDVSDLDLANDRIFVGVTLTGNQAGDLEGAALIRGAARWYEGGSMAV